MLEDELIEVSNSVESLSIICNNALSLKEENATERYEKWNKQYSEIRNKHVGLVTNQFAVIRSNREVMQGREAEKASWFHCGRTRDRSFEQKLEMAGNIIHKIPEPKFDTEQY